MSSHLVIGAGEVGTALANVLLEVHDVSLLDANDKRVTIDNNAHFDMAHICFPWSGTFAGEVKRYQRTYDIGVTVIHSTVPVGTSRHLGAVHSPVMGRHPRLEYDLQVFRKFIAGPQAIKVAHAFRAAGIEVYTFPDSESTELLKLLSTLYYGVCIEFTNEVARLCDAHSIPFATWTIWNTEYNAGQPSANTMRPNLVPLGRIGGHCVVPNADLIDSEFADLIKRRNE